MTGHSVLVTSPAEEPITLTEAKTHLRVDFSTDDTYITSLIVAARIQAEDLLCRALITQTWDHYLTDFPRGDSIRIPKGRLQSVTSLKYTDAEGTESTVDSATYHVVTWEDPGRIALAYSQTWPSVTLRSVGGVCVRFVCGYGAAAAVPKTIKQAMLLTIGHWYENREEVVVGQGLTTIQLPIAAEALLWPYRILSV